MGSLALLISVMLSVNEAVFYTGVTTLLRDPWGGLALVPLITILLLLICVDILIAGVRKNTGNTLKAFYYKNQFKHKQIKI